MTMSVNKGMYSIWIVAATSDHARIRTSERDAKLRTAQVYEKSQSIKQLLASDIKQQVSSIELRIGNRPR